MVRYLTNSEIDKTKWDYCVSHSLNGSYSALSAVLDITADHWDGLVYGDYVAVFPLPWRKRQGIKYIYPPFFTAQLGLFAMRQMDSSFFFNAIPKAFKFVEIILNTDCQTPDFVSVYKRNKTFRLGLKGSYEELFAHFSKNHRQNIRKAYQKTLSISKDADVGAIIELFRVNKGHVSAFKSGDYQRLHQLVAYLRSLGKMEVLGVCDDTGVLCAGGFFIHDFGKIIFMFSGSNEVAKEQRAMFFLFDQFIKEHAESEVVLDFCGSNDENLARFYQGFGSTLHFYDTIRMDRMVGIANWFKHLKRMIRFQA